MYCESLKLIAVFAFWTDLGPSLGNAPMCEMYRIPSRLGLKKSKAYLHHLWFFYYCFMLVGMFLTL